MSGEAFRHHQFLIGTVSTASLRLTRFVFTFSYYLYTRNKAMERERVCIFFHPCDIIRRRDMTRVFIETLYEWVHKQKQVKKKNQQPRGVNVPVV